MDSDLSLVPGLLTKPPVKPVKVKPRRKAKRDTPGPPEPGQAFTANGRTRYVLYVQGGYVFYNLGQDDQNKHAVSLAGWHQWVKEWVK